MRSRQRKSRLAVIKGGRTPCRSAVADLTILREICRDVIGIGGGIVTGQMARNTGRGQARKLTVAVTVRTLQCRMSSRQRKSSGAVIEIRGRPRVHPMTGFALRRETCGLMVDYFCILKLSQMACNTFSA